MNTTFKTELLEKFAKELLQNGFKIYVSEPNTPDDKTTYILIEKDNKIGYIQDNYFGGLDFSTVHKPNVKTGTGYSLNENGINNPTIDLALNTFIHSPHWASSTDRTYTKKYKDFDEYIKLNTTLKYEELKEIKKMVNEQEGKKIRLEAQEITKELCTIFEGHLTALINQDGMETVVGDIVEKTLVCKANRDNPEYPLKKETEKC